MSGRHHKTKTPTKGVGVYVVLSEHMCLLALYVLLTHLF